MTDTHTYHDPSKIVHVLPRKEGSNLDVTRGMGESDDLTKLHIPNPFRTSQFVTRDSGSPCLRL
eukprot:41123-Eustigmatos_ZCMA.PRE.1